MVMVMMVMDVDEGWDEQEIRGCDNDAGNGDGKHEAGAGTTLP